MPLPRLPSNGQVLVKLSDFSISRILSPIGTKGFAGTEGYIAPEIVRFTGDELYTEKVRRMIVFTKRSSFLLRF